MIIHFKTKKLQKQCENPQVALKDYGSSIGNKLVQRIGELQAAVSLEDIKRIPAARLHRLQGKRSIEYAIDLVHPFRLIIRPDLQDGQSINELAKIHIVRVEKVEDYHGKQKR